MQPLKIKNGQNSGLGLYYKNQRPAHNIGSFQLRNSVGQRNIGIGVSGVSSRPALAGGQASSGANTSAQPPELRERLNPYIAKRTSNYAPVAYSVNSGGALANLSSASHLPGIQGAGGINLRDQFTKQRNLINQQSQSPSPGERSAANNTSILGVQSLGQKQYQSNKAIY